MNQEIWQQLLSLESRDIVSKWFESIHGRQLNARRAKEIRITAHQAREFFKNSASSDNSVRPLLTFYGVASLARATTLLFRRSGGEEGLTKGHGLETIDWSSHLAGELATGLSALTDLKVRTCGGLFSDMAAETNNRMSMHVRSETVDWRLNYKPIKLGDEISLGELIERVPDLQKEHTITEIEPAYAAINEMTFSPKAGARIKVRAEQFRSFGVAYDRMGYVQQKEGDWVVMTSSAEVFKRDTPQFLHAYVDKSFGCIPRLFLVSPLPSGNRYSQLCVTYLVAYILGMLARYYPTHWVSLAQGEKGDALWPMIVRAQRFVESTFPELVSELIADVLAHPK